MEKYKAILEQIASGVFTNMDIALMTIAYWLIESIGLTNAHLSDIMQRLGYTFDTTTYIFSDGTNQLTVYQLLNHAIEDVYADSDLTADAMEMIIDKCLSKNLIAAEQSQILINKLATPGA